MLVETERLLITEMTMEMVMDVHENSLDEDTRRFVPDEVFETIEDAIPHVCRHTFCSRMAKAGMNPKTLQYIMGHSEIGITLNTYTHLGFDDAKEEMTRISESRTTDKESNPIRSIKNYKVQASNE